MGHDHEDEGIFNHLLSTVEKDLSRPSSTASKPHSHPTFSSLPPSSSRDFPTAEPPTLPPPTDEDPYILPDQVPTFPNANPTSNGEAVGASEDIAIPLSSSANRASASLDGPNVVQGVILPPATPSALGGRKKVVTTAAPTSPNAGGTVAATTNGGSEIPSSVIDSSLDAPPTSTPSSATPGGNKKQPPPKGTVEWERFKKDTHKEVERRRRETINEGINQLRLLLPSSLSSSEDTKAKGAILQSACQYIRNLKEAEEINTERWTLEKMLNEQTVKELRREVEDWRREADRLREEVDTLRRAVGAVSGGVKRGREGEEEAGGGKRSRV